MEEQSNGEKLKHRPWISIVDGEPTMRCVEFASHQAYGLANWSKEKGFHEVFVTYGRSEEAEYSKNEIWNDEIMWWREICDWPYYGTRGIDSETMSRFR